MVEGSGYGKIANRPQENTALTHVDFGTPMGELMRRYWQSVALSEDLRDLPKSIRILGEDLVVFRDGQGRTGLVDRHCAHRGTSLEYGKIQHDGIRCCFHGWLFDTEGRCLQQPAEPSLGASIERVRQPWYPTHEFGGLVFAYMGPPEQKPIFPEFDILNGENVVLTAYRNISRGTVAECNWLQIQENAMDPVHTAFLHRSINVSHFTDLFGDHGQSEIAYEETKFGMKYVRTSRFSDGRTYIRVAENFLPNARSIPDPYFASSDTAWEQSRLIGWWVPVDNTHTIGFHIEALPIIDGKPASSLLAKGEEGRVSATQAPRRSYEETQRDPDDREAQVSQGPIAIHEREHLATSDKGVVLFRRRLKQALEAMERGEDPVGVFRDQNHCKVEVAASNELIVG